MQAQVRHHNGTPTLFLDGKPVFANYNWLTSDPKPGEFLNRECIEDFARAGVHLNAVGGGVGSEWVGPGPGRTGPYDFTPLHNRFRLILDADPEALFHFRIYMEMGDWWNALYPDEREIVDDGIRLNQSYASTVWRDQCRDYLRTMAEDLRREGLLDRVIAWQVQAGVCGEWIKNGSSMQSHCGDFSGPMRRRFRSWLRARYHNDVAALRAAWADPSVSFETAEVPPADMQRSTTQHHFRDPAKEQRVADYYHNLADLAAEVFIEQCRTVKEITGGKALAGGFFGYLTEISWNDAFFGNPDIGAEWSTYQRSGHLGLRTVLASPDVDFIVSPYSYPFRGIGGDGLPMPPSESVRRAGKLYIYEEDSRMHNRFDPDGRNYSFEHGPAIHQRNVSQVLTHGLGIWWFQDNPPGKYREWQRTEPGFQPLLERFQALGTWALDRDRTPCSQVAVLLDDESMFYEDIRNSFSLPGIWHQRHQGLARFGAPYDIYLLQDLIEGKLPGYRLYIFLNAFHLDSARRAALSRELKRDGRTALWIYAPGYVAETLSLDAMTELTGFRFERGDIPWGPFMHVTRFDHPATRDVPQDLFWGTNNALGPLFHVKDPDAHTLGEVVYSLGRCKPGLAVKELPQEAGGSRGRWTSWYCAAPNIPAPVLRGIAKSAGVHIYNEQGDVLTGSRDLLAVHTLAGGRREFRLPAKVEVVYDLYCDRPVASRTDRFTVDMKPVSSALWYTGTRKGLAGLAKEKK
jgi:hypothetical protein